MKNLFLFAILALTLGLTACHKKADVKYRIECTGYDITAATVVSEEFPVQEVIYATEGAQTLSYEWVGIKRNVITVHLNHAVDMGEGVVELYADDKLIGKVTGEQPTLYIDRTKK